MAQSIRKPSVKTPLPNVWQGSNDGAGATRLGARSSWAQGMEISMERRGQAFQYVGEIGERIDVLLLAGLDETVDHGGALAISG